MKSIIIGKDHCIESVYSSETIEYLKKEAGLDPTPRLHDDIIAEGKPFPDVEYIFSTWGMSAFTEEELAFYFPKVKGLFHAAGSVKTFAESFLKRGAVVSSAYEMNAIPVAEFTLAQILLASKGYFLATSVCSVGDWEGACKISHSYPGNYNINIGIIGAGMIGKTVCRMLKSFDVNVLVYDPYVSDEVLLELGAERATLEEIFSSCTVISNHLPNIPSTVGMLNYNLFSLMGEHTTFINTGRSAQVVEEDLCRILTEKSDVVALIDVLDPEPAEQDCQLFRLPNAFVTPHIAGSHGRETHRMSEFARDEFIRFINGEPLHCTITIDMLPNLA